MDLTEREKVAADALSEVMKYRTGQPPYNFSALPWDERENAMFDAWQEVEVKVRAALATLTGETK